MKKLVLFAIAALALSGCQMKQKVMDASIVSMTYTSLPTDAKLADAGPVSGKFCADSFNDKGSIGLFDEAVKSAQTTHKIDFITNATFWRDEHGCILLEGTGQRLAAVTNTEMAEAKPTPAHAVKKKK
jgi:hypothetical protein